MRQRLSLDPVLQTSGGAARRECSSQTGRLAITDVRSSDAADASACSNLPLSSLALDLQSAEPKLSCMLEPNMNATLVSALHEAERHDQITSN